MSTLGAFERLVPRVGRDAALRMQAHWQLVCQWQQTTNLTGIRNADEAVTLHYEDACEALPFWQPGTRLVDVGSGAGFPGLALAALRPEEEVVLVEPRRLRLAFLREAKEVLSLDHVRVIGGTLASSEPLAADCMTMRAVFSRDDQLDACARHLRPAGSLLVFRQGHAHQQRHPRQLVCVHRHPYRLASHARGRSLDQWRLRATDLPGA